MNGLLDTHVFLWFVLNDVRLSSHARELIADPANTIFLSPASYWEIAIKVSLGKLSIPRSLADFLADQVQRNQFTILPIRVTHTAAVGRLAYHHRDPFDRMLVAQSMVEGMPIISADSELDA